MDSKTNSVHINTRQSTDKEIAFKDEIKRKYHLSETTAELIAGRVELALMEQRKKILAQCKEWLLDNTISHYNPDTDARWVDTNECEDSKEFAYRFEADMNKLLEE